MIANIPQTEEIAKCVQREIKRLHQDMGWGRVPKVSPGLVHMILETTEDVLQESDE